MIHVFLDTNIYLRVISQGKAGCEREYFDDLALLVEAGEVRLLVAEVVVLEIEAKWRRFVNQLVDDIAKQIEQLKAAKWESEVDDVRLSGIEHFQEETRRKKKAAKVNYEAVQRLLAKAVTIPLTTEIMLAAKKRMIAQKMPRKGSSGDQDCLIIESLMVYFAGAFQKADTFRFCSENYKDFADELPAGSKRYVLHPHFTVGLPPTEYCQTLDQAMSFNVSYRRSDIIERAWGELEIARATKRELLSIAAGGSPSVGLKERMDQVSSRIEEIRLDIEPRYERVCSVLPEYVKERRRLLTLEIIALFARCRQHEKWDDRSELKVGEHIGHIDELLLPLASYSQLVKARDGLNRYLALHEQI